MIKKIILSLLFCLLFYSPAFATVFLTEDWEYGDSPPACWPDKSVPTSCCAESWHGWSGRSWDCDHVGGQTGGRVSNKAHTGTYSLYVYRPLGDYFAGHVIKDFATHGSGPTKIYFRAYFYFPASWSNWNANTSGCDGNSDEHAIYFNTATAGNIKMDFKSCYMYYTPWAPPHCYTEGVQDDAFFQGQYGLNGNDTNFDPDVYTADCWNIMQNTERWIAVEWMFDIANSKYALWIDGVQKIGTGGEGVTQTFGNGNTDFYKVIITDFRSSSAGISHNFTEYYIDDIVISDTHIGLTDNPPVISNPLPSGQLNCASDPGNKTISVATDENATCKYDTSDTTYDLMANTFGTTGALSHNQSLSLACNASYTYYTRCMDAFGNKNSSSQAINFSIAHSTDTTPPAAPSGVTVQ